MSHRPAALLLTLLLVCPASSAWAQSDPVDLDGLIAEALASHPAGASSQASADAAGEVASRVSAPPDPWLSFGASNLRVDSPTLDSSPMSGLVLGVRQGLPFPGKLLKRRELADASAALATARVATTDTMIELRVKQAYWTLRYAEEAARITTESAAVIDDLADAITARFSVGQAAQQDALQVQVAEGRVRSMLQARKQAVVSARRRLESAVGRPPQGAVGPTRAFRPVPPLDRADALARLLDQNPELVTARRRVDVEEAAVREARADLAPDLGVAASYRIRDVVPGDGSNGADMVSGGLAISLPVWAAGKQAARVRERRLRVRAADAAIDDLRLALESELAALIDEAERLTEEIGIHQGQLEPQANQALDASVADYTVGGVGFVSVLDNWRVLLDVELATQALLTRRAVVIARIEALTGPLTVTSEEN